jgi:hypothetical protein
MFLKFIFEIVLAEIISMEESRVLVAPLSVDTYFYLVEKLFTSETFILFFCEI